MHRMNGRIRLVTVALAVIAAVVAGGCSGDGVGGDKAGGAGEPVVLRMANTASNLESFPAITDFVGRVKERSGGTVRIEVVNEWGKFAADAEQQVVRAAAAGQVDLGHAGTRVFDTMGVTSLQALQAPMLIDSYALQRAVIEGDLPREMLHGLDRVGVAGLSVLGGGLSKPIAVKQPLLGSADWRGIAFGTYKSEVQAQAIRSLGATPMEVFGKSRTQMLQDGKLQGFELNLIAYQHNVLADDAPYVTANVNLWPWTEVLFANPGRLAALTGQQREWLQQAAADAAGSSVGLADRDAQFVAFTCKSGARFANASEADLGGLRKAVAPVYAKLSDNLQTKAFIERIQGLKRSTPAGAALGIPAGCSGVAPAAPAAAQQQAAGALSGTYRWTITKNDVAASKTEDKSPEHLATFPLIFTMTLDAGKWTLVHRDAGQPETEGPGTYALDGDRVSFTWPTAGAVLTFTIAVDGKGDLHLRPVQPMDAGDQFVWATHPWTKID
jgi:TRAP-type C4-dicarboxylate transport system substrate-binding protein